MESWLGHPLHSLVKDLLDVGVTVYMSDRYTRRDKHLGRRLDINVLVRHPEVWLAAQREMTRAVSFLGRDDVGISFSKRKERCMASGAVGFCAIIHRNGFEGRLIRVNVWEARAAGSFSFGASFTQGLDPNRASSTAGNGLASLLLGTGSGNILQAWKNVACA